MTKSGSPAKKSGRKVKLKNIGSKKEKKSNANKHKVKGDSTDSNKSCKTIIDYASIKAYLHDIEDKTGFKVHPTQISKLKEKLRTTSYSKLSV